MASGRDQLDEPESGTGPEPAGGRRSVRPSRVAWHTGVVLVFALAGALFLTARDTANGQGDIRPDRGAPALRRDPGAEHPQPAAYRAGGGQRADQDALTRGQSADARVKAVQDQVDALAGRVP